MLRFLIDLKWSQFIKLFAIIIVVFVICLLIKMVANSWKNIREIENQTNETVINTPNEDDLEKVEKIVEKLEAEYPEIKFISYEVNQARYGHFEAEFEYNYFPFYIYVNPDNYRFTKIRMAAVLHEIKSLEHDLIKIRKVQEVCVNYNNGEYERNLEIEVIFRDDLNSTDIVKVVKDKYPDYYDINFNMKEVELYKWNYNKIIVNARSKVKETEIKIGLPKK